MALATGSHLKVWKINAHEKFTSLQVSSSKKNKSTGKYETDFSGFITCWGNAHDTAMNLNEGDTIKVGGFNVTTNYNKEKKVTYTNFNIFDFEIDGNESSVPDDGFLTISSSDQEELPFN